MCRTVGSGKPNARYAELVDKTDQCVQYVSVMFAQWLKECPKIVWKCVCSIKSIWGNAHGG